MTEREMFEKSLTDRGYYKGHGDNKWIFLEVDKTRVVLLAKCYTCGKSNPTVGSTYENFGTVAHVHHKNHIVIRWDNGTKNRYRSTDLGVVQDNVEELPKVDSDPNVAFLRSKGAVLENYFCEEIDIITHGEPPETVVTERKSEISSQPTARKTNTLSELITKLEVESYFEEDVHPEDEHDR